MSGRVLAIVVFVLTTALYVAGLGLIFLSGEPFSLNELVLPSMYAFAVVGVLIARRRPRNAIAWICLGIGLVWGLEAALFGAVFYGLANPGALAQPELLAAFATPLWVPGIFVILTFLVMLFPNGRLPSPRWKWLPRLVGTGIALTYVFIVLADTRTHSYGRPVFDNPLAGTLGPWFDEGGIVADLPDLLLFGTVLLGIPVSVTALVMRYRRSEGMERHQLKWLATAGSTVVVLFLISIFLVDIFGDTVGLVAASFLILIPISIGIAVLRYRLYEIDRLLSRTVTYGLVTGVLIAVFLGTNLVLQSVLAPLTADSNLGIAASTLAVAALFNPIRKRAQTFVDRRFNRARYDAQQEIDRFAERLRTDIDLTDLTGEVLAVVSETMQPASASMWIREDR